jgi:hypothetical protein
MNGRACGVGVAEAGEGEVGGALVADDNPVSSFVPSFGQNRASSA